LARNTAPRGWGDEQPLHLGSPPQDAREVDRAQSTCGRGRVCRANPR
jgi:hypothetical protein